jgi:AraC family transcriptional regulator
MADRHAALLFQSELVQVWDVACRASRSGCGEEEWAAVAQVVVPRRGVFVLHRGAGGTVADPTTAVLLGSSDHYRVSHPADGGDDCTMLVFRPDLVEEAFGADRWREGNVRAATQLGAAAFTAALVRDHDALEADETAVCLLGAVSADLARRRQAPRIGPGQRQRVERVRELVAAEPTASWRLDTAARAVHCSPYHLARQFRAATGETLGRYVLRLRLALAVQRLAEGEWRLAGLAVELGFAHHSHFSASFRRVFGTTPCETRDALTRGRLAEMRKIVTAAP